MTALTNTPQSSRAATTATPAAATQPRGTLRHGLLMALCALLCVSSFGALQAQVSEDRLKVALIYNFAKFSQWPDEAFSQSEAFVVGVLGDDPVGVALQAIKAKPVHGRSVEIRYLENADQLPGCHLLFISHSTTEPLPEILSLAKTLHILTVSDSEDFTLKGGVISIVKRDRKASFDVNIEAAKETGVRLGSELLKRAKIVKTTPSGTGS